MTKIERIEEHSKSNQDYHLNQIKFFMKQENVLKGIVGALGEMEFTFAISGHSVEIEFLNEEEARKGREIVSEIVGIVKWEKDFNAYITYQEPKWRWTGEKEITENRVLHIHILPTSPKPDCVPRLQESQSYTSRSWVCEKGGENV